MITQKFIRKAAPLDAVQVTPQNMPEVARWSRGTIRTSKTAFRHGDEHIYLDVKNARNPRLTTAFPGDWVVKMSEKLFKIYPQSAFDENFRAVEEEDQAS